ncbi:hypothetical protein ACUNV4_21515 [Granulosicoccus sp. 3-233]|uniref:hypothetical protein n=1 Tax=Granulosicoccus sp. 3-233 TaxID=3417969 RepID=UPI003D3597A8
MKLIPPLLLTFAAGIAMAEDRQVTADVWVDNWFELYVNGEPVLEDSVPISTERSFNAETASFTIELPAQIAIQAKDFKENDTGLEYIGSGRQQMGDGGMIFQIRDSATGELLAVSDEGVRCLVVHHAPVDPACADELNPVEGAGACASVVQDIPGDWTSSDFDDSHWPMAVAHSERAVSPKGGYDRVRWDNRATLIWSEDLVLDNTLLCRVQLEG